MLVVKTSRGNACLLIYPPFVKKKIVTILLGFSDGFLRLTDMT